MRLRCRDGKNNIVLGGMLLMGAMELYALSGKRCLRWKGSITEQVKWSKRRSRWCLIWPKHLSGSVSHWCGPGIFEHQRCAQFEGCVAEPLQTITGILPETMEPFAPLECVATCIERSDEGVSEFGVESFLWMIRRPS